MIINISGSGSLEFNFGVGTQAGFFDWVMYPYNGATTCTNIVNNSIAPVRCNWNGSSIGGTGLAPAANLPVANSNAMNYEPTLNVLAGQQYLICFSNYSNQSTNVPLVFGGTAAVSCIPLGLDLTDFTLNTECPSTEVTLSWKAPVRANVDHYVVERSLDGYMWENIIEVTLPVAINGNEKLFSTRAEMISAEMNYFRIKEIDMDGVQDFSAVKLFIYSEE